MLVYIVTFVQNDYDHIVGAFSTRIRANEVRNWYDAKCKEGDYTFITDIELDAVLTMYPD